MPIYTKPLFPYDRKIEKLDILSVANGKKIIKNVNCKYAGSITDGTLLINMCNVIENFLAPTSKMSIGEINDEEYICEYPRYDAIGTGIIDIAIYNRLSGNIKGCQYDTITDSFGELKLSNGSEAVVGAMLPLLNEENEFKESFEWLVNSFDGKSIPRNEDDILHHLAKLCENYYRRIKNGDIITNLVAGGNISKINRAQVDAGIFNPAHTILEGASGWCVVNAEKEKKKSRARSSSVNHSSFVNQYILDSTRILTEEEKKLVPTLPEYYVIPEEAVKICEHAKLTHDLPCRMVNYLLRGPAGTGKTSIAQAIAAGFNLPYVKYTCSAGTEVFDLIGQIFPAIDNGTMKNQEMFNSLLDEIVYTPEEAYTIITGTENPDATTQDCVKAIFANLENAANDKNSFTYQMTDLLKAIKYGWVVEIQEPATIVMAGVLVALNSLLEKEGSITLPTEEIITRHPDAIVVATTNVTYEGCRHMNQSFLDRMDMILDVELPEKDVICERIMRLTGASEEAEVEIRKMIDVVNRIAEKCNKEAITDGVTGIRALTGWVVSTFVTGSPYLSALDTVISKATEDPDIREDLIATCLEPVFSKGYKVVLK